MHERLVVKELADAMHVSTRYVYEMRRCGFRMDGVRFHNKTATLIDGVAWVIRTNFRIVDGVGVVDAPSPSSKCEG